MDEDDIVDCIVAQGNFLKKADTSKSWHTRYFIVTKLSLQYWRNQDDYELNKKPKQIMAGKDICSVKEWSQWDKVQPGYHIEICTPYTTWYMVFQNNEDRQVWEHHIRSLFGFGLEERDDKDRNWREKPCPKKGEKNHADLNKFHWDVRKDG